MRWFPLFGLSFVALLYSLAGMTAIAALRREQPSDRRLGQLRMYWVGVFCCNFGLCCYEVYELALALI